jgi:hypothetical protein
LWQPSDVRNIWTLERWPVGLLIVIGVIAVATNVPPLQKLSWWHLLVAACAALGFGSAAVMRLRRQGDR